MGKYHDLEGFKTFLVVLGVLLIVAAVIMAAIAVPSVRAWQQLGINTYYHQAMQAATPADFGIAMVHLDQALEDAGMVSGTTQFWLAGRVPHRDMEFTRGTIRSLALYAEQLASYNPGSVEQSTGLVVLRQTLGMVHVDTYGFWAWSQGGDLFVVKIPFFCVLFGIGAIILATEFLDSIRIPRRPKIQPGSAS